MKRLLPALAVALIPLACHAATLDDWRADIATIDADLRTIHPNPFTKTREADFRRAEEALLRDLPGLGEEQRMVRTMQLVALVGDGHTQLEPDRPDFGLWYPVRIYEFSDGLFVTAAFKTDADLAAAQILSIGGKPAAAALIQIRSLMGADNIYGARENLFAFHNAALMKGLGLATNDGALTLKVRLAGGRVQDRLLRPLAADDKRYKPSDSKMDWRFVSEVYPPPLGSLNDWTTAYRGLPAMAFRANDPARPPHLAYRRPYFARAMPEERAYYVQVNNVQNMADEAFIPFIRRVMSEIDKARPDTLIFDIRYNPGGDGSVVPAMIREFIKREDARPWKHLYLLTGRKTFSAAVMMLQAFEENTEVTVLGEPAGAGPDSYGDATAIDLPRTGMALHVSTLFHKLDDAGERGDATPVAVPTPFSSADYRAGRDPAVDAILRGDEMRSLPIIAMEEGAEAARKIFAQRKRRYSGSPDLLPPRRIDLLKAVWALRDANRKADAADFAALATDIYPDSARAWSVRGDAEMDAGRKADGLASYRKALALDPNNIDNLGQRATLRQSSQP